MCDCQKSQLTGIPCSHVIVVCQHRNALQSTRFSTSHDPRDNNRSTEGRQNQERQDVNASTRGARGNILEAES
jgi:SWIM zinc finger